MLMVTATDVTFLTVAIYLLDLGIKIVALGLVPEGRRPSSATAWLLLILFLPIIGLVDRGRRRQQAAGGEVISSALTAETNDLLPVLRQPVADNGHARGRRSLSPHVPRAHARRLGPQAAAEALPGQCHALDVGFAVGVLPGSMTSGSPNWAKSAVSKKQPTWETPLSVRVST